MRDSPPVGYELFVSEDPVLLVDVNDGVALLTLNRPASRNALSAQLRGELREALDRLGADDACRSAVLSGAGETFCAGFDLKELAAADDPDHLFADADAYHAAVHGFAKPIVAAVNGPAVAGGFDLAAMCDLRICAPGSTFGQPQVRFGVPAAFELTASVVPGSVARELCLSGRLIDAAEALSVGLVSRVVDDPVAEALALATTIAEVPAASEVKAQIIDSQPRLFG